MVASAIAAIGDTRFRTWSVPAIAPCSLIAEGMAAAPAISDHSPMRCSEVLAVMDALHLESAAVVGWSDGACTGLVLARQAPASIAGVFYFACNMDPSGTKPFELTPTIQRCLARHTRDYAELSTAPDQFQAFAEAVQQMQRTEPNYSPRDLAEIQVPILIDQSHHIE